MSIKSTPIKSTPIKSAPLPTAPPPITPPPVAPATDLADRDVLFALDGPIRPGFVAEAVRTLLRSLPLDTGEPEAWANRRMAAALDALAALYPRDEIEIMLAVQAIAAYHAAAAAWHLGMNHHRPRGDSTRHLSAANAAARTFDTMLKAMERRQAKALAVPAGRPAGQVWAARNDGAAVDRWVRRLGGVTAGEDEGGEDEGGSDVAWTPAAIAEAEEQRAIEQFAEDYEGLDLDNTPGILAGGSIVVPETPTPAQRAYMARRYSLNLRDTYHETLRTGGHTLPSITPVRPGDTLP